MVALKSKTYTADATATILISTILGIFTEGLLVAYFF
jgi:malonate transporter